MDKLPNVIPVGGSNPLGMWDYLEADVVTLSVQQPNGQRLRRPGDSEGT